MLLTYNVGKKTLNCLMMNVNLYDTIIKARMKGYGCTDPSNNRR